MDDGEVGENEAVENGFKWNSHDVGKFGVELEKERNPQIEAKSVNQALDDAGFIT